MSEPRLVAKVSRMTIESLIRDTVYGHEIPSDKPVVVEWLYDREGWLDGAKVVEYSPTVNTRTGATHA